VLIALLLVVQVTVVVRDALALGLAAREGAREAAVSGDDARAAATVRRSASSLDADRIAVRVQPSPDARRRGDPVTVTLDYVERVRVAGRALRHDLPLHAAATMRLERTMRTPAPTAPP